MQPQGLLLEQLGRMRLCLILILHQAQVERREQLWRELTCDMLVQLLRMATTGMRQQLLL
jgi:hypothetical protein